MTMTKTIPIVQNVDRAIKRKDYDVAGTNLLVTSYFRTIQGEGPFAGYPSIFVRLAGCNFGDKQDRCAWCDTAFQFDKGVGFDPENLLELITKLDGYSRTDVLVITGGEPTLQHNLLAFLTKAIGYFSYIQIETNGTQPTFFTTMSDMDLRSHVVTVVSPKASAKANRYPELSPRVLWATDYLKFVVTADENDPHHKVPDWAFGTGKKIYVSPMAVYLKEYTGEVSSIWEDGLIDKEQTAKNYKYAAEYAMANNMLLSLQTHLFIGLA